MTTAIELQELAKAGIRDAKMEDLVDIADVKIHTELDTKERIWNYVEQIKNPYLFKARGMMVKISFSGKRKLEDCISDCFF